MYVVQVYTFTPGPPLSGTVEIPAILKLEDFDSILNVTRNSTLYKPDEGSAGGIISYANGNTIVTLEQNTSYCQSTDKLQIVIIGNNSGGIAENVHVTNSVIDPVNIQGPVTVENWPTSFEVSNDVGNPLPVTGLVNIGNYPLAATDAFGRQRVSNPYTLFDSSHRFSDNGLWATQTTSGGTAVFNANQGLVDLSVTTSINSEVIRETTKVFSYQPGKSLVTFNTFVFEPAKAGLRQRVGYYGSQNGFYLELNGAVSNLCFVKRSYITGSEVETRISQMGGVYGPGDTGWNLDKLDGNGPSGITLDISKAQIMVMDIEWLGVGSVRLGFVINGQFIYCHQFNHANLITSTYITTASLPLRYEIKNVTATATASTLKQICSTVISEGGYELRGSQQSVGTPITTAKVLTVAGTFYPVVSLRLKSNRLDSIVTLTAISIMGSGNNEKYRWQVMAAADIAGGSWSSAGTSSSVEYNLDGTAVTGGRILAAGFTSASNQGSPSIDILKEALFAFQLERDGLTNTPYTLTLAIAGAGTSQSVYGSLDWEEISR